MNVSEVTVRRDLETLERRGVLIRVHGGAMPAPLSSREPPFAVRLMRKTEVKERIGRVAAELILPGETVVIDSGTTTISVARALKDRHDLRVMALSLHVAAELVDEPGIEVVLPGGSVRSGEHALSGSLTTATLEGLQFDTAVLTVAGLSLKEGLTEYRLDDAAVKHSAFYRARRRIAVTDSGKLGRATFKQYAPVSDLTVLVTDDAAPAELLDDLRAADIDVRLVAS
jgi:DeoR/GlpR family transcriptional regulator of sugar metabolism